MDQAALIGINETMSFPERLKQARAAAGKTQRAIAEAMGVSVQAVSQWENGQSTMLADRLARLAELLGVSVDWLENGYKDEADDDTPLGKLRGKFYAGNTPNMVVPLSDVHKVIAAGLSKSSDEVRSLATDFIFIDHQSIISPLSIRVPNDQLLPDLKSGDIAIFDMGIAAKPGDIVAVLFSADGYFQVSQLKEQASRLVPAIIRFDPGNPETSDGVMLEGPARAVKKGQTPAIIMLGPLVERRTFPRISSDPLDGDIK